MADRECTVCPFIHVGDLTAPRADQLNNTGILYRTDIDLELVVVARDAPNKEMQGQRPLWPNL